MTNELFNSNVWPKIPIYSGDAAKGRLEHTEVEVIYKCFTAWFSF